MKIDNSHAVTPFNSPWNPVTLHCPNCGTLMAGYKKSEDTIRLSCRICKVIMIYREVGRRHDRLDIYVNYQTPS